MRFVYAVMVQADVIPDTPLQDTDNAADASLLLPHMAMRDEDSGAPVTLAEATGGVWLPPVAASPRGLPRGR